MIIEIAQLIGELVGLLLFGIYLPTLFLCLKCLLWDDSESNWKLIRTIRWLPLVSVLVLFACSALSYVVGGIRAAQILYECLQQPEGLVTSPSVSVWFNLLKSACSGVSSIVEDGILVYRCWIIWGKNRYLIVLPLLLWLGVVVTSGLKLWVQATSNSDTLIAIATFKPTSLGCISISIINNLITTPLILYRLWKIDKEVTKYYTLTHRRTSMLQRLGRAVVESGALHAASSLLAFATYVANSNFYYVTSAIQLSVGALAFNMIIIRSARQGPDEYTIPTIHHSMEANPAARRSASKELTVPVFIHSSTVSSTDMGIAQSRKSFSLP